MQSEDKIPAHVAIIMDGNGRWARQRGLPKMMGHKKGSEAVRGILKACGEIGVRYLTLYAFSTENWKRPQTEVKALMRLLQMQLERETRDLIRNNVRLNVIGRIDNLPEWVRKNC